MKRGAHNFKVKDLDLQEDKVLQQRKKVKIMVINHHLLQKLRIFLQL